MKTTSLQVFFLVNFLRTLFGKFSNCSSLPFSTPHGRYQQQQRKEGLLPNADNLTFSPSRIKCHHPKCPKYPGPPRKPSNIQDQMITVMVPLNSNNNLSGNNNNHHNQSQQMTTTTAASMQQVQQQAGQQQQQQRSNSTTTTTQTPMGLINGLNNGNNSHSQTGRHHSSSENSVQSLDNGSTAGHKNGSDNKRIQNATKPETESLMAKQQTQQQQQLQVIPGPQQQQPQQQKTILLKFPQNLMETDQLIVSFRILLKIIAFILSRFIKVIFVEEIKFLVFYISISHIKKLETKTQRIYSNVRSRANHLVI